MKRNPQRILVAPAAFKGSLEPQQAARAIARGLKKADRAFEIKTLPLSDGGEGFAALLTRALGGRLKYRTVQGPLTGSKTRAKLGWVADSRTVVLEAAQAVGLTLLEPSQRNPMKTDTYGLGELVEIALGLEPKRILIGLGGSSTCDGGRGMAQALGWRFEEDRRGRLQKVFSPDGWRERLGKIEIVAACDVTNPLLGPNGATYVFAPQKGARPKELPILEERMKRLQRIAQRDLGGRAGERRGNGAAGGLGWATRTFLGAKLQPGIDLMLDALGFDGWIGSLDWAITGEGSLDDQSLGGKAGVGLARRCAQHRVPVLFLAGRVALDAPQMRKAGIEAAFPITNGSITTEESMARAESLLTRAAESCGRLLMKR